MKATDKVVVSKLSRAGFRSILYTQGVKAEDVKQGALGDCWLVAAMATLAGTMPGAIIKLFINSERSYRQGSCWRSSGAIVLKHDHYVQFRCRKVVLNQISQDGANCLFFMPRCDAAKIPSPESTHGRAFTD